MKKEWLKYFVIIPLISVTLMLLSFFINIDSFFKIIFSLTLIGIFFVLFELAKKYSNSFLKIFAIIGIFLEAGLIIFYLFINTNYDAFYLPLLIISLSSLIFISLGFGILKLRKEIKLALSAGVLMIVASFLDFFIVIANMAIYLKTSPLSLPISIEPIMNIGGYLSLFFWVCFQIIIAIIIIKESQTEVNF